MNWKLPFALLGLVLMMSVGAYAQGCTWCTSVTDDCCDGTGTSANYTLTCATTSISAQYDAAALNKVYIEIVDVTNNIVLYSDYRRCDCVKETLLSGLNLAINTVLRFKVGCDPCDGVNCAIGSTSVTFYTPSTNACAANCTGS